MIELSPFLGYESARTEVKKWSHDDLEDFLMNYEDRISPFKRFLATLRFGYYPSLQAVEDEFLQRGL